MHVRPLSEYRPLDSNAPAIFRGVQIANYSWLAAATLVLYDHLITLELEVDRIWTLRWGLPKFLFLISRYVMPATLMVRTFADVSQPFLFSFCVFVTYFEGPIKATSLIVVELVLLIRVSAIYGHNKIMQGFLACLFICQVAAVILTTYVVVKGLHPALSYASLPGCWFTVSYSRSAVLWRNSWWIPFVCGDGILLILTLVKTFHHRNHLNPTIRLLARDSVLYFIPMFATLVWNISIESSPGTLGLLTMPSEWIACISVTRMMLSIRSLTFDGYRNTIQPPHSAMVFQDRELVSDKQTTRCTEETLTDDS